MIQRPIYWTSAAVKETTTIIREGGDLRTSETHPSKKDKLILIRAKLYFDERTGVLKPGSSSNGLGYSTEQIPNTKARDRDVYTPEYITHAQVC